MSLDRLHESLIAALCTALVEQVVPALTTGIAKGLTRPAALQLDHVYTQTEAARALRMNDADARTLLAGIPHRRIHSKANGDRWLGRDIWEALEVAGTAARPEQAPANRAPITTGWDAFPAADV